MRISKYLPIVLCVLVLLIWADSSFAADNTGIMIDIQTKFQEVSSQYISKLKEYAFGIFKIFVLIDIAIFGLRAALNRSEIGDTISQFLMMLVFAVFCAVAIKYYDVWTQFLLDKSKTIAAAAGGANADINLNPINTGFTILNAVIASITNLPAKLSSIVYGLGYLILGGVILVCFILMSVRMLIVLCESYIAMSAAILLLGFGGSSMVKDYAINTMRYAVSVAFKLFTMRLVLGVGMAFITDLGTLTEVKFETLFTLLAAAVVLYVLIQTLPETVAGIINGSHTGSGVGVGSAAKGMAVAGVAGAAAVAGGAIGAAKAYNTVSRAVKLASMDGHSGPINKAKGAAGHLWDSFHAARQEGATSAGGSTFARMHSNIKDMHQAQQAMKDPNYQSNAYRANRFAGSAPASNDSKPDDSADNPGGG